MDEAKQSQGRGEKQEQLKWKGNKRNSYKNIEANAENVKNEKQNVNIFIFVCHLYRAKCDGHTVEEDRNRAFVLNIF